MLPWIVAGITLVLDLATKHLVAASFSPQQSVPVLAPALYLTYVQNTGAAFGILQGRPWIFVIIAAGIIVWIVKELGSAGGRLSARLAAAYGLVLGGAAGNLIDRLRFGYVIDFIDFRVWPVFNVADSAITIGVALLILHTMTAADRPKA